MNGSNRMTGTRDVMLLGIFLLLFTINVSVCDENEVRLERDLMQNYSKTTRPSENYKDRLNVELTPSLANIISVDERNQLITTSCWIQMNWTDVKLRWNPDEYGNISEIHLPHNLIWKPDIILHNLIDSNMLDSSISTNIPINSNGVVLWWSNWIFKSSCSMNIQYFPFDVQSCFLVFGSWSYDMRYINIIPVNRNADLDVYAENSEFELIDYSTDNYTFAYAGFPSPFAYIRYKITMKRKPLYYLFNILMPTILLTMIALLGFFVHGSGEKISIGITTLLSMVVFQMVVADRLPPVSDAIPLISIYYGMSILIISFSTSVNVFTLYLYNCGESGYEIPGFLKRICFGRLSRIICTFIPLKETQEYKDQQRRYVKTSAVEDNPTKSLLRGGKNPEPGRKSSDGGKESADIEEELRQALRCIRHVIHDHDKRYEEQERSDSLKREWHDLAHVIDRFSLIVFLTINGCLIIGLVVLNYS